MAEDDDYYGVEIGNSFGTSDETTPLFRADEDGNVVGGATEYSHYITMNVSKDEEGHRRDDRMNRIHEIFHTFGMNHPKEGGCQGIMHYPPLKPTITDANSLIYNQYMTKRRIKK